MSNIFTMPTDCAPTNGTPKMPGWAQCADSCSGCTECTPNPDTDCGQLMIAGGFTCAPPTCTSKCCMAEPTDDADDADNEDAMKESDILLDKMTKQQKVLSGVIIALILVIIVLSIMLIRSKKQ